MVKMNLFSKSLLSSLQLKASISMVKRLIFFSLAVLLLPLSVSAQSPASGVITYISNPAESSVGFSLDATMHTVHGSFAMKKGEIRLTPGTNKMSGEIILDAASAKTGISARDNKMNKDVLESDRFPEITFKPDRVEGSIATQRTSTAQVHGIFTIHGMQHEMTVPIEVKISANHWEATSHFTVPYVSWGMKNPSNFLLHVKEAVEIEVKLAGDVLANQSH